MTKKFLGPGKRSLGLITAGAMAVSLITVPAVPSKAATTDKPHVTKAGSISVSEENVTQNEPFASYTAGSKGLRIPTLITLENGDLLGTADARWERYADGGGLDTIASVSSDGGKTWHYSFPFFFPDSNGFSGRDASAPYWSNATTIIDSCILEGPDGTVYCFADVNPTGATTLYQNKTVTDHADGYYIGNNKNLPCAGSVGTGTGYVTVGGKRRLALTKDYTKVLTEPMDDDLETYPYYVGDFKDGYAPILKRSDSAPTGFGVDEWYNLYTISDDGTYVDNLTQDQVTSFDSNTDPTWKVQQNVYYEGSEFHIYCIAHIWMVTSKDHGRTWSDPKDINDQVKRHTEEHAILVSPGQGMVTSDGTIAFGVYDNSGNIADEIENASIVYSSDRGETWKRSDDVPDMWSSENEIVEIDDGQGTLRMFFRNGNDKICYADAKRDHNGEYHFQNSVITDVSVCSSCNVSAISYSKKINGKQAIMVACPSGGGRANGKIYTFLVNDDPNHTMELQNAFALGSGGYSYSCLTEQADGSLALVWEKGNQGGIFFNTYDVHSVVPDAVIGSSLVKIEIDEGEEYIISGSGEGTVAVEPDDSCASVSASEKILFSLYSHNGTGTASSLSSFLSAPDRTLNLEDAEFTFTASGDYWKIKSEKNNTYLTNSYADTFFNANAIDMKVVPADGKETFYISQSNGKGYVIFYTEEMNFNKKTEFEPNNMDYEVALLEKQPSVSEDDIIPGYRQVSGANALTSGKRYLIARVWDDDNVIILYPVNGKNNQTKRLDLSQSYTRNIHTITGVGEGYTYAVIDGVIYRIHVTKEHPQPDSGCSHTTVEKNKAEAICEAEGYTGDFICTKCDGIVKQGSVIPALEHSWDEGSVSKAVTETENGEITYHCTKDASHTKTEKIYVSAYAEFKREYQTASAAKENEILYTQESLTAVSEAMKQCEQVLAGMAGSMELYEKADSLKDANKGLVRKSADALKEDVQEKLNFSNYTGESLKTMQTILDNLTEVLANPEADTEEVSKAGQTLDTVIKVDTARTQLQNEIAAVQKQLADTTGYTAVSVNALKAALTQAQTVLNQLDSADADTYLAGLDTSLKELSGALSAIKGQKLVKDTVVDEFVVNGMTYKVLDTNTVKLINGANKKNVTVPNTITGSDKKVYQVAIIGNSAFKNKSKLKKVTINANITTIEKDAFKGCKKLANVVVKNKSKLKTVGGGAFKKTSSKIKIKLPKNLKNNKKLKKQLKKSGIKNGL